MDTQKLIVGHDTPASAQPPAAVHRMSPRYAKKKAEVGDGASTPVRPVNGAVIEVHLPPASVRDQSLTIPGTVDVAAYHDTPASSGAREASYGDRRVFGRRRVEALQREALIMPDAARVHPDDRIRGCFVQRPNILYAGTEPR